MSERAEVLAKVLAEHSPFVDHPGTINPVRCGCSFGPDRSNFPATNWLGWNAHVAAALDAALAAQEGERGGAEVAAAVEAIHGGTHWCFSADEQNIVYEPGTQWWPCRTLAALADSAGALRQHDAEVLRAAAEDVLRGAPIGNESYSGRQVAGYLRARADRIAGDQP